MAEINHLDLTWETLVVAAAGEIANDETASAAACTTFNTPDISSVDEVTIRIVSLTLHTATSIDLYPQVSDDGAEWAYMTYAGGSPIVINVDWDGTRESRVLPPIAVRGQTFRVLVGSTGTAGNEAISLDVMRHQWVD